MYKINEVLVNEDKTKEEVKINGKTYYVCSVCGRLCKRKTKSFGKIYCNKHYKQNKRGKILDTNPRTIYDRNEIEIYDIYAKLKIYNKYGEEVAETIIDREDVDRVRYIKWKLSHGYVLNNSKRKGSTIYLHRVVLDTDQFVDHINHNILDNRKSNLRIVTKSQNQMNVNYKGVSKTKEDKWYAYIKINQKMINLGKYIDEEEALYARWYAEKIIFKEYRYPKEEPFILDRRKEEIQEYINQKVQRL